MKKEYIKPITELFVADEAADLLCGSVSAHNEQGNGSVLSKKSDMWENMDDED